VDQKIGEKYTAVLLAAGYGSRISELTKGPKSLLTINDKTLLEHHFEIWKDLGIKNINLVLGYEASAIEEVASKYEEDFNINYLLNEDFRNCGNTFSLYVGIQYLENTTSLIFDADLVYDKSILEKFLRDENENQILVGPSELTDIECAKTLIDQDGFVRMTVDKRAVTEEELSKYSFAGEAIGILKFSPKMTDKLAKQAGLFLRSKENINKNWEHLLNEFLPHNNVSTHFNDDGKWIEIDTPEDFKRAVELFKK